MLFSSTVFLYFFLPAVLLIYYGLLRKSRTLQNVFLFLASLFFYAFGEPKFVLVLLLSIIANWFFGLLIDRFRDQKSKARGVIVVTVSFNLIILFVAKYLNFSGDILQRFFGIDLHLPEIALPIGVSFFTFQALSYVIDVYRGKGRVQKNLLYVGLYISFFPQLIAGPIVRYETVADEILNRHETAEDFFAGFQRFIVGLSKKVLFANSFAVVADKAFDIGKSGTELSVCFAWLGILMYTLQVYFDFSGYSDMAIGLGRMFGFHFLENFNYPYLATSITDFWRRWHISLGTWFRDYVYFPMGGSRVSRPRHIFNLFFVWFLTGLWHGANYTFIIWGLMFFVLISFEKLTELEKKAGMFAIVFRRIYTLFFIMVGRAFFRADTLPQAWNYLKSMFGMNQNAFTDTAFSGYFMQNLILIIIGIAACTPVFKNIHERMKEKTGWSAVTGVVWIACFVLSLASLVSSSYNPFIYFNF